MKVILLALFTLLLANPAFARNAYNDATCEATGKSALRYQIEADYLYGELVYVHLVNDRGDAIGTAKLIDGKLEGDTGELKLAFGKRENLVSSPYDDGEYTGVTHSYEQDLKIEEISDHLAYRLGLAKGQTLRLKCKGDEISR